MVDMVCDVLCVGPIGCNCVILADGTTHEAFVVDPGGNVSDILMRLAQNKLNVKGILHTHGHVDHVGGTGELKRITEAPCYLNKQDMFLFENAEKQAAMFGMPRPEPAHIEHDLNHGDKLSCGSIVLEVRHTPGHSPGSVSFVLPEKNLCLSGDALFAGGIGRTDLPSGDFEMLERSIKEQLYTLDADVVVIPGHGPKTQIGKERTSNPFVRA